MWRALLIGLACIVLSASADAVDICYNYGCAATASVELDPDVLGSARRLLLRAHDAAEERQAISLVLGLFEIFAGEQTPTSADKGGNANDEGINGRMDCIDESTNATRYLYLLESRGWLKHHAVLEPVQRSPLWINVHWAARIAEKESGREFAVDTWFFDNGRPAAIFRLNDWLDGAHPL